ncbi:MAG: TonB-dependent receptor [Opitutaceae bacterium]|nr:TonB-dependent receptor [Opitutaceae bacterium]
MKGRFALLCLVASAGMLPAQPAATGLPAVTVYSTGVANQDPVGSFAMPVSALRFEPRVDLQARNLAEGQADIAIRGGTFENTGIRLGALPLYDPQTGHYFAEIPVAPAMLAAPEVLTGAENAARGWNATAGTVAFGWRPVRSTGALVLGGGQFGTNATELYQGYVSDLRFAGHTLAADAAVAYSASDGSMRFGESRFNRANARVQLASKETQTDLVYGYQAKFFGWPNLYTPFNSNETENLETALFALNHRTKFNGGDFVEFGAYGRRNKDDYAFNRFAPVGPVHPFQHTTRVNGAALDGRVTIDDLAIRYKAGMVHDDLQSTSLTFGAFHTRTFTTAGVFPEKRWKLADGRVIAVTAGATYDDTNRDGSAVSPVFTLAQEDNAPGATWTRLYFSYARATQEPTYTALNSNPAAGLFRGNPNLGRSASQSFELGGCSSSAGWNTSGAVFYRRDDRLVDWTFKRGVTARTANAVTINTSGVEIFARRSFDRIDIVLGYTWLAKDADYGTSAVDASFYALNYPKQRLTAAITARLGGGWEVRLDSDLRLQAGNLLRATGGDRAVLSSLGFYFCPPKIRNLTLALQTGNLWNSSFQAVPAVPAAKRQLTGSATYMW